MVARVVIGGPCELKRGLLVAAECVLGLFGAEEASAKEDFLLLLVRILGPDLGGGSHLLRGAEERPREERVGALEDVVKVALLLGLAATARIVRGVFFFVHSSWGLEVGDEVREGPWLLHAHLLEDFRGLVRCGPLRTLDVEWIVCENACTVLFLLL